MKQADYNAFMGVTASLAAAISILERTPEAKEAAGSDKMFEQMMRDYNNSLAEARMRLKLQVRK